MQTQYETVHMTAGRDYQVGGYEYVIMADVGEDDLWITLDRKGGFKTNAAAKRAGLKAAQTFLAPALV